MVSNQQTNLICKNQNKDKDKHKHKKATFLQLSCYHACPIYYNTASQQLQSVLLPMPAIVPTGGSMQVDNCDLNPLSCSAGSMVQHIANSLTLSLML